MALDRKRRLAYTLGYSIKHTDPDYSYVPFNIPDINDADDIARVDALLDSIDRINSSIDEALADSMAQKVDNLTVDFNRQIQLYRQQGSRLLSQLSILTAVPVSYDMFTGFREGKSVSPIAVRNYS
jgi:hypothetical protein